MPFFVRGGLENATYLYVGVSKMHFYVCVGLKTSFFGMWGPENAIFCGSLKMHFHVSGGLENSVFCVWGLENAIFVCGGLENAIFYKWGS